MDLQAKSEWNLDEMSRDELVYIWETYYEKSLSDLGSGYITLATLKEAIASKLEADDSTARATSSFDFVDVEEAESLDEEAEASEEYEWYSVPGSSARRKRRKK
jgi:hypothetical protein